MLRRMSEVQLTVMSGGQTGVDRGALDAALAYGVRAGGWCPDGRGAEDGPIPARYPLTPLPGADNAARSRRNVLDSDGTVLLLFGPPRGGTRLTLECCVAHGKPHLLIDASRLHCAAAAERIASFVSSLPRGLLNVAGPRASEAAGAYDYSYETLSELFRVLAARGAKGRGRRGGGGFSAAPGPQSTPRSAPGTPGAHSMGRFCYSCAAPLDAPGFAGPSTVHCRYCTDTEGALKSKKAIREGIARWLQSWQPDLSDKQARKRARRYLSAMPEWAD